MKELILGVVVMMIVLGCSPDLYEEVRRSGEPPRISKPYVECFKEENLVTIFWEYDDAADEYLLYRDSNPFGLFSTLCYRGRGLEYEDRGLNAGMRYYYKLAKRREETVFPKSECVMGVSHVIRRDQYEVNNSRGAASHFIDVLEANIYYYCDDWGNVLEDVDWYWIELEPRRYVVLRVWFPLGSDLGPDELYFSKEAGSEISIGEDFYVNLYNYEYEAVRRYFRISVRPENFGKGKIGVYQIKYISSQNVN